MGYFIFNLKHQNLLDLFSQALQFRYRMKNTDRLLKIGKKLEKEGLSSFKTATPGGAPAYFRSHGLQIIPSEAEELDTNKACQIVITPEASALSGLVIALLRILGEGKDGQRRTKAAILAFGAALKSNKNPGWELEAAKNIITTSIKLAETPFPAPLRPGDDWGEPDPFGEHIIGRYSTHWRRAKETLEGRGNNFDPSSRDLSSRDPFVGLPEGTDKSGDIPDGVWIEISTIMGIVLGGHWVPVSFPPTPIKQTTERAIMKALRRKGLRPEIALTIIANRGKDLKRRSR